MVSSENPAMLRYDALLQVLRTADSLWETSRVFFTHWRLSPSQFNVLNLLSDKPEGLSQIEMGRLLIMHRSNVTGLIDRLERRGLVRRDELASDQRAYRIVLSAAGRRLLGCILPEYFRVAEQVWSGIPPVQARKLLAQLKRLSANAKAVRSAPQSR